MQLSPSSSRRTIFLLTILSGLIILLPSVIFQEMFSQGDHGRDLYAYQMTAQGAAPYRDYLWVYGPLMPYYYAAFFKFLGFSISNILLAETILKFLCGVCVYFIMLEITESFWPYLTAIFFWSYYPHFFYTYNHTGGTLCLLATTWHLIRFIKTREEKYLNTGLIFIFLLSLIKINFGLCMLGSYVACVFLIDRWAKTPLASRRKFFLVSLIGLPLSIILAYGSFFIGLPGLLIKQSFPYTKAGWQHTMPLMDVVPAIWALIKFYCQTSWRDLIFFLLMTITIISCIVNFKKLMKTAPAHFLITQACLLFLAITHLHEYVLSGVQYRFFWSLPYLILIGFACLAQVSAQLPKLLKNSLMMGVLVIVLLQVNSKIDFLESRKDPKYFLGIERGGVLLGNSVQWTDTVQKTVLFLEKQLEPDEMFFALPYEPLYYYLLGRPSPTYQYIFFDYMLIPAQQDAQTVADLKEKNIRWVVLSNRGSSREKGIGNFGVSHSQMLSEYLSNNFELTQELGIWGKELKWNDNHGIRILKMKQAHL